MRHSQTRTLDRRLFLKAVGRAGKTLAAGSLLSPGVFRLGRRALAKEPALESLLQTAEIRSRNGILEATITAAPARCGSAIRIPGMLYNGSLHSADLRAQLGDTLRITFRNNLIDRSRVDRPGYVGPICTSAGYTVEPALSRHERLAAGPQRQRLRPRPSR